MTVENLKEIGESDMPKPGEDQAPESTLGAYLAKLRNAARMSLRQVEEAANGEVSNAYLSQLENGKISKPSPNVLHALAGVYKTSYETLMERAGYMATRSGSERRNAKVATFAIGDLSSEEENALLEYLAFYRQRHKKR